MSAPYTLSSYDIDYVIECIEEGNCIFIIGPRVLRSEKGLPFHAQLFEYLKTKPNLQLEPDKDFMVNFANTRDKYRFSHYLKEFYNEENWDTRSLKKLVQIPCSVFINTSPDLLLKETFEELGIAINFDFYNKKSINGIIPQRPSQEKPLVFNLFGRVDVADSLILSQKDMLDYINSLFGNKKKLPGELMAQNRANKLFIFLGFEFGAWYLRLILVLLELHERNNLGVASGKSKHLEDQLRKFYEENFEMEFIPTEVDEYIDIIYQHFAERGKLRSNRNVSYPKNSLNVSGKQNIISEVRLLIADNNIEEAIKKLIEYCSEANRKLYNQLIGLSATFNALTQDRTTGVLDNESFRIEMSKILTALLEILKKLEDSNL